MQQSIHRISVLSLLILSGIQMLFGQGYESIYLDTMDISVNELNIRYQPSRKRVIDIEHIRLEVKPIFEKKSMYGKAFLNIRPYNLPITNVELDAKGMDIRQVFIIHPDGFIPVNHTYDNLKLNVQLHREYDKDEQFTLFIEYIAEPYKLEEKGIELTSGRGLYFIDPMDMNPIKPTQMWTQGETESNSVWFPVVDAPNEHFTQEIHITVDQRYTTLSNGLLIGSVINPDGTKTDHWEQRKPHGPHLVMMAAGIFHMAMDDWGPIKVTYYTAEEYKDDVRKIFGQTPYMISYFSRLFKVDYPWEKYAQMVVYDYTSGAMENTSAVIFYDAYFADRYDLLDRNYDETIVHELVHQWFGNLVACESWAHLALNESFATYGEYLWYDYKYSREDADHLQNEYLFSYLNEFIYKSEPIVNFYFDDAEELFDAHRYDKGSCVLHMLRDYLGDQFFFDGLEHYLYNFKFHSAEIHDLRHSFEKISGEDLNWFFEQWFMEPGHPMVDIAESYDKASGKVEVVIKQFQDIRRYTTFQFPLSIDVYLEDTVIRHEAWVDERKETIHVDVPSKPLLVNVDAKKIMLWEKEEDKSLDEWIYQYRNAPLYVDRLEAINNMRFRQSNKNVRSVFLAALDDPFWHIRQYTLNSIELKEFHAEEGSVERIQKTALRDESSKVRKAAILALNELGLKYAVAVCDSLFQQDSSRIVKAAALSVLYAHDPQAYYKKAESVEFEKSYHLNIEVANIYADLGDNSKNDFFKRVLWSTRPYYTSSIFERYVAFLERMDIETLNDAATFLSNLAIYEESDYMKTEARNALYDLKEHFSRTDEEKAGVLKAAIEGL